MSEINPSIEYQDYLLTNQGKMRQFASGATRDSNEGKPDYFGFTSALVTKRFGEYMMKHQRQSDGQMRSSSNWKRGIDQKAYLESLVRHIEDVKLIFEGNAKHAREPLEDALCASLFNIQGLLLEVLKEKDAQTTPKITLD